MAKEYRETDYKEGQELSRKRRKAAVFQTKQRQATVHVQDIGNKQSSVGEVKRTEAGEAVME